MQPRGDGEAIERHPHGDGDRRGGKGEVQQERRALREEGEGGEKGRCSKNVERCVRRGKGKARRGCVHCGCMGGGGGGKRAPFERGGAAVLMEMGLPHGTRACMHACMHACNHDAWKDRGTRHAHM
eukprot:360788-Chlamydomonas_euryale.AAC.2